jgi:hypothetical protein
MLQATLRSADILGCSDCCLWCLYAQLRLSAAAADMPRSCVWALLLQLLPHTSTAWLGSMSCTPTSVAAAASSLLAIQITAASHSIPVSLRHLSL